MRLHYVDEGDGAPVLLLHGEPTWAYLYRKVIPQIAPVARCIAPDYFGFGRSDKPVAREWYSYDTHTASLERFVDELDLREVTVVMQDWGGPLGMRLAVERPDRIARLVVMNTGIFSGRPPSDTWLRFRELVRRTGTEFPAWAADPHRRARPSCQTTSSPRTTRPSRRPSRRPECSCSPSRCRPSRIIRRRATMLEVREKLGRWDRPALVFFGDSDPIFSPRVAERIAELIPGAELQEPIAGAGHFLQEDAGEEVGQRIAAWLKSTSV